MLAYVSQTTLSVGDTVEVIRALKRKYPSIAEPKKGDICYATTNRQEAVKFMAPQVDLVIVIGSQNSSNSSRLREVAEKSLATAYMVDAAEQIDPTWLVGKIRVGVTAGASAPEALVDAVVVRLAPVSGVESAAVTVEEEYFPPPPELRELLRGLESALSLLNGVPAAPEEAGDAARRVLADDRTTAAADVLEQIAALA